MRIYYIDESEGPRYCVRSALGVNAERWNGLHGRIQDWRTALAGDYSVPTSRELHACDLLAGRGKLARIDNTGRRLTPEQGAEIFMNGLRIIENAAHSLGGIEVVNVCLRKADVKGYTNRSAWTGCSTASTPPSRRTGATPTSSSTREGSAWSGGSTAGSGAATPCPASTRRGRTARRRRTSP